MALVVRNAGQSAYDGVSVYMDDGRYVHAGSNNSVYITEEQYVPDEDIYNVDILFDITKSNDVEGLVSGWASIAINADGSRPLDWDGDIIEPDTLDKAAVDFMLNYRSSGVDHTGDAVGDVVESIVFTKEKQEALGIPEGTVPEGWFITVKLRDVDTIAKVKDGTLKMFSIQGKGKRYQV